MASLNIGIVGAGIGGLAAAALLAQDGHRVTIAERFATPRPLGSGLVVQPVGLVVLDALGAGDAARAVCQPIARMLGHAGKRVVLDVRYRPAAPGLAMHRAALFHLLWQAAARAGVTMETGEAVTDAPLRPGGAGRLILRERAPPLGPFDLVVDAGGAGSALSPLRARALPFGAIWGHVPWPGDAALPQDRLTQRYLGAHRMAGVLPIGRLPDDPGPRAAVFWSLPRPALDRWAETDLAAWKAEVTAFWPEMAPFLAPLTGTADMTPARYSHGTLRRPFAPRLLHLGDAAHRASPQLGQGANMALLDAMALAQALRQGPADTAAERQAQMRRTHVAAYQAMSAAFTPMYQSDSRALPLIRDHLLAPLSRLPGVRHLLTALVSGDLVPPLGR